MTRRDKTGYRYSIITRKKEDSRDKLFRHQVERDIQIKGRNFKF